MKNSAGLLLLSCLCMMACRQTVTSFAAKVVDSDSLAINYFTGDGKADSVTAVKIIRDKDKINQLGKMIAGYTTDEYKCGSDGTLHFFKNGVVAQDVSFRMQDVQCMHFSFVLDDKLYSTELKPETKQLLESLKK